MLSKFKKKHLKKLFLRGKRLYRFDEYKERFLDVNLKVRLYKNPYVISFNVDKWYNQKEVRSWSNYSKYVYDIKYDLDNNKVYIFHNAYTIVYGFNSYSFLSNENIADGNYTIQQLIDFNVNPDHLFKNFYSVTYSKPDTKNLDEILNLREAAYKESRIYRKTRVYRNRNRLTSKLRKVLIEEDYNNDLLSNKKDLFEKKEFLW